MATKAQIIGIYGENHAKKYFENQGFNVEKFGSEMSSEVDTKYFDDDRIASLYKEVESDIHSGKLLDKLMLKGFDYVNIAVHQYIYKCWEKHRLENPLPYSGRIIVDAMKEGREEEAESMKNKNRKALKEFPKGHPGRYDFILEREGENTALEVKVNKSRLSYWQKMRLSLLRKFNQRTMVVNLKISKDDIDSLLIGENVDSNKIDILKNESPFFKNFNIPSENDFLDTLKY